MIKKFTELNNGDKFTINSIEYEKIETVKVSCCSSINAKMISNNQNVFIQPSSDVEVPE